MSDKQYDASHTALLLTDPYNDFLSDGGKLWPMVQGVAEEVGLLDNLRKLVAGARAAGIQVFILPHRRFEPGDYENWDHPNPSQLTTKQIQPCGSAWKRDPGSGVIGVEKGPLISVI